MLKRFTVLLFAFILTLSITGAAFAASSTYDIVHELGLPLAEEHIDGAYYAQWYLDIMTPHHVEWGLPYAATLEQVQQSETFLLVSDELPAETLFYMWCWKDDSFVYFSPEDWVEVDGRFEYAIPINPVTFQCLDTPVAHEAVFYIAGYDSAGWLALNVDALFVNNYVLSDETAATEDAVEEVEEANPEPDAAEEEPEPEPEPEAPAEEVAPEPEPAPEAAEEPAPPVIENPRTGSTGLIYIAAALLLTSVLIFNRIRRKLPQ